MAAKVPITSPITFQAMKCKARRVVSTSAPINENDGAPFLLMRLESFGKRCLAFRPPPWDDAGFFYTSRRCVPERPAFQHGLRRESLSRPFSIPFMSMLVADFVPFVLEGNFLRPPYNACDPNCKTTPHLSKA
ncbi:hypothetical protein K737_300058 [Holospora undulata HU1]|uniref:Uncharacterized protein n=2 Tax=Holospora undulata HU1 TaxID=1321371 RepID=A0A061JH54_9PROT|nr:hypothetical protein K737_300058 [Holospora undulata HU1]